MAPTFIEELLRDAETKEANEKIEIDKLRADQLLTAIGLLEHEMTEANELVEKEIALLEEYRSKELSRVDKKLSWLTFQLEQFMRSSSEKTIRLPHGVLKLRKGRHRIVIADMDKFLERAGKRGLLKQVPESFVPDMQAISEYHKKTKALPDGCQLIPGDTRFSYSTTMEDKNDGTTDSDEAERAA